MKITKLSRAVKNINNINIFLDHKYWISLHERHILDFGLYKDFEVSEELKLKLESVMSEQKILLRLQKFILRRPRSIMELQIYMKTRLEISDLNYQNELISKLGIKDDLAFAEWFISNCKFFGKMGKNKVVAKLKIKGVSNNIIESAFRSVGWEQDNEAIVAKAKAGINETDPQKYKSKLIRRLISKGLSYGEIKKFL